MLTPRINPPSDYATLMAEAIDKIPIYTKDWTNFNPSDPGITMLEYLLGYQVIQEESIDSFSEEIYEKLLGILGYKRKTSGMARVLIDPIGVDKDFDIPADCRFMVGEIPFETGRKKQMTVSSPVAVISKIDGEYVDGSFVLDRDLPTVYLPFGKNPSCGEEFYIVFNRQIRKDLDNTIYLEFEQIQKRNEIKEDEENLFSAVREFEFEYYSEGEFKPLKVLDKTLGFLRSGELEFKSENDWDELEINGKKGYVLKITLKSAENDVAPRLKNVSGLLFELLQKETKVITYTYPDPEDVKLVSALIDQSYIKVFAREKKGGPYYLYDINTNEKGVKESGRFYRRVTEKLGHVKIEFDKEDFDFYPYVGKDAVKVAMYSEEMMRKYRLGNVYGYDNQEINLPALHIVKDTFTVIAKLGEEYHFLKPDCDREGSLNYTLLEDQGKIRINDAGNYIGAELYLGSTAVSLGDEGNVRAGNVFELLGGTINPDIKFINPKEGTGGAYKESLDSLRKRMIVDLNSPLACATAKDFERIIGSASGLIIRKVHAYALPGKDDICVAVLPGSNKQYPVLSAGYRKRIEDIIENRRLLGQRVFVVNPCYSKVNVRATVYVKSQFVGAKEEIEETIRTCTDYVKSEEKCFGDMLSFDSIFSEIEALDSVAYVKELTISPANPENATLRGADIIPNENVLLVPGEITIKTVSVKE